ncbi:MAG: sulfur oxidation c-type cytochrome SoxA [Hydrogenophilales bacterium 28-61-23]|nr:MAG: sulfur oxidation c-type cytochrome SoxA [Hydrogenophilales bacterium 28-61-23]
MKKIIVALASLGVLMGAVAANAGPEEDRLKLVKFFGEKYSDVKAGDYIYGSLAFDPDSMSQYKSIMEFPPYSGDIDKGEKLWKTALKSGKTYADCLPNGGKDIAGNYPMFDDAKGKVVTLEDVINACRVANGDEAYAFGDPKTMGLLTAYMRTLSDGMKMNIKVEGEGARKAYEDGKKTFYSRAGQFNFSCANCHVDNAGNRLRSELLSPAVGHATHWPVFRGGDTLVTLQKRYEGCHKNVRQVPDKAGSTRYNNLEYFHSYISNGLPLQASVFRK